MPPCFRFDSEALSYETRPRFLPSSFPQPASCDGDLLKRQVATFSQTTYPSALPGIKGFQAITAELATYLKKAFEDPTRALEQLVGVKSVEQAVPLGHQPIDEQIRSLRSSGWSWLGTRLEAGVKCRAIIDTIALRYWT